MSEPIKYLSPTKIVTGIKCGEQLRLKYAEKLPELSSGTFHLGKSVHAAFERALRAVILGQPLPDISSCDDLYLRAWDEKWKEEEEGERFIGWRWDEDDSPAKAKEDGRGLVRLGRNEVLPHVHPKFVEHDAVMDLESDIGPFRVYGILDLLEENGLVTDWKTAKGKVSPFAKQQDFQIDYYGSWFRDYANHEVAQLRKVFFVRTAGKPKLDVANYNVGPERAAWMRKTAAAVWKMTQAGAYVPNTTTWACSERFCSFWDMCAGKLVNGEF